MLDGDCMCIRKNMIKIILIVCGMFMFQNCAFCEQTKSQNIRVCILKNVSSFEISISTPYRIFSFPASQEIGRGEYIKDATVDFGLNGIRIQDKFYGVGADIVVDDIENSFVKINNRTYRGIIRIIKMSNSKLLVINILDIEKYLYGVLYYEISHKWPMEMLKAQAICSRTFASYLISKNMNKQYDATSDVYSQVYAGATSERKRVNMAVDSTKGQVLLYKGNIFQSFFHSCCGGHTEDSSQLWNVDLKPLKGRICPYCGKAPHYGWEVFIPYFKIEEIMVKNGVPVEGISGLYVKSRDNSGRAVLVEYKDSSDTSTISAKELRNMIGPDVLKSTLFDISNKAEGVLFIGKGWGHGVGLCQWGGKQMADSGKTSQQILKFYYPGSRVEKRS